MCAPASPRHAGTIRLLALLGIVAIVASAFLPDGSAAHVACTATFAAAMLASLALRRRA